MPLAKCVSSVKQNSRILASLFSVLDLFTELSFELRNSQVMCSYALLSRNLKSSALVALRMDVLQSYKRAEEFVGPGLLTTQKSRIPGFLSNTLMLEITVIMHSVTQHILIMVCRATGRENQYLIYSDMYVSKVLKHLYVHLYSLKFSCFQIVILVILYFLCFNFFVI